MNWHNEVIEKEGWFEELRKRKITDGVICGGCGEWPEFCCCKNCSCCQASISGKCLAVSHNLSYCEPICCGKMEGNYSEDEGDV